MSNPMETLIREIEALRRRVDMLEYQDAGPFLDAANGRIGINNVSPDELFDVAGTVKCQQITFGVPTELTIASGVITITKTYHTVDTQGDSETDDLDTVNGGVEGDLLILRAINAARTVVCKDATGNLLLAGDCTLDHSSDTITLLFDGTNWIELSRSDNTA